VDRHHLEPLDRRRGFERQWNLNKLFGSHENSTSAGAFALLASISLASSLISRPLFFALVIPTTMPGAFFWKNAGFIEHAREIGLAEMPQLGVVREHHHPFRMDELIETLRTTSLKEAERGRTTLSH